MSKLVGDGRNDASLGLRFLELSRTEKVSNQDCVLVGVAILLEQFSYCIHNGGLARASLTSEPEYTRAPGRGIVSPISDLFQYLDTRSDRALFTF